MRTVGVEEELLVVDAAGVPVPKGPEALEVAARRGEGEDVPTHDLADRGLVDDDTEPGHLVPELKAQQIELGTRVCTDLAELDKELRFWRARAESAATAVGAHVAALATSPVPVEPVATEGERYGRMRRAVRAAPRATCSPAAATCTSPSPTTRRASPSSTASASGCRC